MEGSENLPIRMGSDASDFAINTADEINLRRKIRAKLYSFLYFGSTTGNPIYR
jgi:hypothetical protein